LTWSTQNKLSVNTDKTKEIVFHCPAARNLCISPPLPGIERVKQAMLLGVDVTDTLSTAAYVDRLLMQVNQRLYLLSLLQSSGLQRSLLNLMLNALVIDKLTCALPAYAGQLTADNKNRINAISRKAMRRGLTLTAFDIETLIDKSDCKLFRHFPQPGHSLHHHHLPKTSTYRPYQLRKRQHPYLLPTFPLFSIHSLKIVISIVVYLSMYNFSLGFDFFLF